MGTLRVIRRYNHRSTRLMQTSPILPEAGPSRNSYQLGIKLLLIFCVDVYTCSQHINIALSPTFVAAVALPKAQRCSSWMTDCVQFPWVALGVRRAAICSKTEMTAEHFRYHQHPYCPFVNACCHLVWVTFRYVRQLPPFWPAVWIRGRACTSRKSTVSD